MIRQTTRFLTAINQTLSLLCAVWHISTQDRINALVKLNVCHRRRKSIGHFLYTPLCGISIKIFIHLVRFNITRQKNSIDLKDQLYQIPRRTSLKGNSVNYQSVIGFNQSILANIFQGEIHLADIYKSAKACTHAYVRA